MTMKEMKKKYKMKRTFIQTLFGYCPTCRKWLRFAVDCRRLPLCMPTPAPEERFRTSCRGCYKVESAFWIERWKAFWTVMDPANLPRE